MDAAINFSIVGAVIVFAIAVRLVFVGRNVAAFSAFVVGVAGAVSVMMSAADAIFLHEVMFYELLATTAVGAISLAYLRKPTAFIFFLLPGAFAMLLRSNIGTFFLISIAFGGGGLVSLVEYTAYILMPTFFALTATFFVAAFIEKCQPQSIT